MSFFTDGLSDTHTFGVHFLALGRSGGLPAAWAPGGPTYDFINTLARNALFRFCWPPGPSLASAAGGPSLEADLHSCAPAWCLLTLMLLRVILSYLCVDFGGHHILQKPKRARSSSFFALVIIMLLYVNFIPILYEMP